MQTEAMHSIPAERYILGSIFRDNRCMDDVVGVFADDFYLPVHQDVFQQMQMLSAQNVPIDPATVGDALRRSGKIATDAEEDLAGELMRDEYTTAQIAHHVKIVKRHSIRRRLKLATLAIQKEVENPSDPDELLDTAERILLAVREKGSQSETKPLQFFVHQTLDEIESIKNGSDAGLTTGIPDLDKFVTMRAGQLIVIGARPGGGKSICGMQFGVHNAANGKPVVFYSLEMSGEELSARALSSYGSIDASYVTRKRLALHDETQKLTDTANELSTLPMFINEKAWNTVGGIIADARRMKRKHNVELVIVDYLQLVQSVRSKGQMRYEQLGEITQSLKHLAKELKVPVILLAQLSRESEKNAADKEPQLWHIKESGSAEQDADIVLLLWSTPKDPGMENVVHIKIAKNRQGLRDVILHVHHAKQFMRFSPPGAY